MHVIFPMQKLTNSYIYTEWIEKNIILFLAVICLFFHADAASAEVKVETVADNLKIPWELVFAPDGKK